MVYMVGRILKSPPPRPDFLSWFPGLWILRLFGLHCSSTSPSAQFCFFPSIPQVLSHRECLSMLPGKHNLHHRSWSSKLTYFQGSKLGFLQPYYSCYLQISDKSLATYGNVVIFLWMASFFFSNGLLPWLDFLLRKDSVSWCN